MRLFDTKLKRVGLRDRKTWHDLACPNGQLISPYLLPEFADLINAERRDVRVVIAEDGSEPVGFFAYHAPIGGIARPVGAPLSDYQGFAAGPNFRINGRDLLDAISADALVYDNWHGNAPGKVRQNHGSTRIDLSEGSEAWFARHKAMHKSQFKKIAQRQRKAEREFGPISIVFGDPDQTRFEFLRVQKSVQYQQSGLYDLTTHDWTARVFENAALRNRGPLKGLMASLYLGEQLVAVEMGLRSGSTYHSWIPAYAPEFSSVSPGLLLLNGIIERAEELGISYIDLGLAEQNYKKYFGDFDTPTASGRLLKPSLVGARVVAWEHTEKLAQHLPGKLSTIPGKLRRRWAQTAAIAPGNAKRLTLMASALANAQKRLNAV